MAIRDPLAAYSAARTPQTQPVPGRRDQVRDNAGGYVFDKSLARKVDDFLVLGTAGGTYYVGEDRLTATNIGWLLDAIRADGAQVVSQLVDASAGRPPRAPKPRPSIFTLAQVFGYGDAAAVQAAKAAFPVVIRTTDHFAMFFGYAKQAHGKPAGGGTSLMTGRALRSAMASWFLARPDTDEEGGDGTARVAWKVCKARQRKTSAGETFALRDALRVAHPKADTPQRRVLLGWIAGKASDSEAREVIPVVDAFLTAQAVVTEAEAVRVVTLHGVPWEFLPSRFMKSAKVWEALAGTVGMTALIRNLALMTRLGILTPFSPTTKNVVRRLTSGAALNNARVHPMDVFLALRVYNSGRSQPHPKADRETWTPVGEVSDALEEAYDLSFGHVRPSGRSYIVAVDSSGSMSGHWGGPVTMGGSPLGSPYEIGCAMALMHKRIEGAGVHLVDIDTSVHPTRITKRTSLREIGAWAASGGGTDLSLPFAYASMYDLRVDGFVVYTDGETWAGRMHPFQALSAYRRRFNPEARVVVAAMAPVGHTIGEPGDVGVLNIAGMDSSLLRAVTSFLG